MKFIDHNVQGLEELILWKNWLNWPLPGLKDLVLDNWPGLFDGGGIALDISGHTHNFSKFHFASGYEVPPPGLISVSEPMSNY